MGIDFSHCDARWAYSGFMRFRERLAATVGIIDFSKIERTDDKRLYKIKNDPLYYILAHSDCDGNLTVEECRKLAPRLKEVLSTWPDDYDKLMGLKLVDGMLNAVENNEPLEFL